MIPCLGPDTLVACPAGALVSRRPGRCLPCTRCWQLTHPPTFRPATEARQHRQLLELWRGHVGSWCPGDQTPGLPPHAGHASDDLTVHHAGTPAALGGHTSPRRVLCRSRNAAVGARVPAGP